MMAKSLLAISAVFLMLAAGFAGCINGGNNGAGKSYFVEGNALTATIGAETPNFYLRIEPFSENSVKVHFSKDGNFSKSGLEQYGFISERKPITLDVKEKNGIITVKSGEVEVKIGTNPFSLSFGRTSIDGIVFEGGLRSAGFKGNPSEHFFGLGQRFSSVDQTGKIVLEEVRYGSSDNTSLSGVPFFISTGSYGIFLDTTYKTIFDFSDAANGNYDVQTEDGEMRFYYIAGDEVKSVLQEYTNITGKSPMQPKWTFGYWQSKFGYMNRLEFETVAAMMRELDYPCDALVQDYFWRYNQKLEWYEPLYPDHQSMIASLTDMGYKIVLHEDTAMIRYYEGEIPSDWLYPLEDFAGYFIHYGPAEFPFPIYNMTFLDVSNEAACQWYAGIHLPLLFEGADAFWVDETDWTPENGTMPYDNGMMPDEMHNLYNNIFNKVVFESMANQNQRGVILTRGAWAGCQRCPWVWSGDVYCTFDELKGAIIGGQTMGLSGFPFWSNDLGGYQGRPTDELQVRWSAEFGAFCPMFRVHGMGGIDPMIVDPIVLNWYTFSHTSLLLSREPWSFSPEAQEIFRFYDKLRYQLIPYIYSCAREASETGMPLMRAMVLEFPDDANCYDKSTQYMFGPYFLVAPVCEEGATEKKVYLPEGRWVDYWTKEIYEGPIEINYPAPLDVLPLFMRAGAIIPMGPVMNYTDEKPLNPVTFDIYPLEGGSFALYEDDGISTAYKDGVFSSTNVRTVVEGSKITVSVEDRIGAFDPGSRGYEFLINCISKPISVKLNGAELSAGAWNYDAEKRRADIRIPETNSGFEVTVET